MITITQKLEIDYQGFMQDFLLGGGDDTCTNELQCLYTVLPAYPFVPDLYGEVIDLRYLRKRLIFFSFLFLAENYFRNSAMLWAPKV